MRLGVIGPMKSDLVALAKAAQILVDQGRVERVIYLGKDDALDSVVASWAADIVGANPSEAAIFERAAMACVNATPEEIEEFVAAERVRRRLRVFTSVPAPAGKAVELLDGRIAVFVYDKATLDEDDIGGAHILVFGRSEKPLVHRVGSRTFIAPGALLPPGVLAEGERGGLAVFDDDVGGGVRIELLSPEGATLKVEKIEPRQHASGAKLKVQGPG